MLSTFLIPALYASVWSWLLPLFIKDSVQGENYDIFFPKNQDNANHGNAGTRAKWRNGVVQLCATITALFLGVIGGLLAGAIKIPYAWAALEEPFDDDHLFAKGPNSDDGF